MTIDNYLCPHCGRGCTEFAPCICPEAKGEAAARQAVLNSIVVRYTITLHHADRSKAEVFPGYTTDFCIAMRFARDRLLNTMECHAEYSHATITGELGVEYRLSVEV